MIDIFALLLVHGLLFLAAFRLMVDDKVDHDPVFDQRTATGSDRDQSTEDAPRA